jgi:hypothetical protein
MVLQTAQALKVKVCFTAGIMRDPVELRFPNTAKEIAMRMLMHVRLSTTEFNNAIRNGSAGKKMTQILDEVKPENVFFTEMHGQRTALLVVNVDDASKIPMLAEPWFLNFNADVELRIAMSRDDLAKAGLDELGKKWG